MNTYLIQRGVLTPTHTYSPLSYRGYTIRSFGEYANHKGLFVEKVIDAKTFSDAYREFIVDLLPILNRISFLTQCSIEPLSKSSALIYRQNNNPDKSFFFYFGQKIPPVGLALEETGVGDLEKAKSSDLDGVFDLLREANYATTPKMQFALLIIAAEALAGEITLANKYPTLDKQKMKSILTDELYEDIYKTTNIRNRLFHGKSVTDEEAAKFGGLVYQRLLFGHFKPLLRLTSLHEDVKSAPRNEGAYEYGGAFMRPINGKSVDFDEAEKQFDNPRDYETLGHLADY